MPRLLRPAAWSGRTRDAVLALALTAWNQWELLDATFVDGAVVLNHLTFALMTMAVALRRSTPLGCAVLAAVGLTAQTVWGGDVFGASAQFVAQLIAMHAAGSHPVTRRAWLGLAVMMVGVESYVLVTEDPITVEDEIGNIAVFLAVWGLARAVQAGRAKRDELVRDQALRERAAVEAERARVARELHDIVAHGLSLMVLHAGAARSATDREQASSSLAVVEDSGRRAMTELHRLLGMLSASEVEASDSMAGLADIDALAVPVRDTGVEVDVEMTATSPVDRSVGLSAYRIVQEGLTNALKHGGTSRIDVRVEDVAGGISVEVCNDVATPRPASGLAGSGRGLRGLKERVELFGGTFEAGPTTGGWRIRAVLPTGTLS